MYWVQCRSTMWGLKDLNFDLHEVCLRLNCESSAPKDAAIHLGFLFIYCLVQITVTTTERKVCCLFEDSDPCALGAALRNPVHDVNIRRRVWINTELCVCMCVRDNANVCLHLIDVVVELRLIGSHDGGFNRLWRMTFNPENTQFFRLALLFPSSHHHIFSPVYTSWYAPSSHSRQWKQKPGPMTIVFVSLPPPNLSFHPCSILSPESCQDKRKQSLIRSSCSAAYFNLSLIY